MLKGANLKGGGGAPAPPIDQPPLLLTYLYNKTQQVGVWRQCEKP